MHGGQRCWWTLTRTSLFCFLAAFSEASREAASVWADDAAARQPTARPANINDRIPFSCERHSRFGGRKADTTRARRSGGLRWRQTPFWRSTWNGTSSSHTFLPPSDLDRDGAASRRCRPSGTRAEARDAVLRGAEELRTIRPVVGGRSAEFVPLQHAIWFGVLCQLQLILPALESTRTASPRSIRCTGHRNETTPGRTPASDLPSWAGKVAP